MISRSSFHCFSKRPTTTSLTSWGQVSFSHEHIKDSLLVTYFLGQGSGASSTSKPQTSHTLAAAEHIKWAESWTGLHTFFPFAWDLKIGWDTERNLLREPPMNHRIFLLCLSRKHKFLLSVSCWPCILHSPILEPLEGGKWQRRQKVIVAIPHEIAIRRPHIPDWSIIHRLPALGGTGMWEADVGEAVLFLPKLILG